VLEDVVMSSADCNRRTKHTGRQSNRMRSDVMIIFKGKREGSSFMGLEKTLVV